MTQMKKDLISSQWAQDRDCPRLSRYTSKWIRWSEHFKAWYSDTY